MTTHFHSRAEIGLRPPNTDKLSLRTPTDTAEHFGLTGHDTGSGGTLFKPDPIERLRGIQAFHMDTRGYGDIAYEGAFDADGNTFGLRDAHWVGAHALSNAENVANRLTDGICFLEDERGWTPLASEAFIWWVNLWKFTHHGKTIQIFAHEDWAHIGGTVTFCPGTPFKNVIAFCGGHV